MAAHKILIIDDDQELCEELAEFLVDQGYDVDIAGDGLLGRQFLQKSAYDMLILDLKLPVETGFEILKSVKQTISDLKIMVVSGRPPVDSPGKKKDTRRLEETALLNLADCVLSKPLHPEVLLQMVRKLIAQ